MDSDRLAEAKATVKRLAAEADRIYKPGGEPEVDRLRGLLARLEWVPNYQYGADGSTRICLACGMLQGTGHAPDCWLAAELR